MNSYRAKPDAIRSLFRQNLVHRDVYVSPEIFELECERLFTKTWIFAGHGSQIPKPGDYVTTEIAGRPLVLVRRTDGSIQVLLNRCAHKGAKVAGQACGNTGRAFRCPYHAWSYRLDGSLLGVPMQAAYQDSGMRESVVGTGMQRIASAEYRGFVFVRLGESGPSFQEYFGSALSFIDLMANRSPEGELEVAGQPLRNVINCNWKIYLENINDSLHVHAAHESSALAAGGVWGRQPADAKKPMSIELLLPFQSGNEFMDAMSARVLPGGHSAMGENLSTHSGYSEFPDYTAAMEKAYGAERAKQMLSVSPQNMVLYPSIAIKASPLTMRLLRPLDAERTVLEAWAFRPKGATEELTRRTFAYNRTVFSPMSLLAQDDIHVFEISQKALHAPEREWVSLHRGYRTGEEDAGEVTTNGTNEILMRNQFRTWIGMMTEDERECAAA